VSSQPPSRSAPASAGGVRDLNLVVVRGRLAAPPEVRPADPGPPTLRLLVVVRAEVPAPRIDVLPVVVADPPPDLSAAGAGSPVWVVGSAQRRFVDGPDGARSRIEVVADEVRVGDAP